MRATPGAIQMLLFDTNLGHCSSSLYIPDSSIMICGHDTGSISIIDVKSGLVKTSLRIADVGEITSLSVSSSKQVLAASRKGGIYRFDLTNPNAIEMIRQPTGLVSSTIWRCQWISEDAFCIGGTYGHLEKIQRSENGWESTSLDGHVHSIFGLDVSTEMILAGDWLGAISLRPFDISGPEIEKVYVSFGVQAATWYQNKAFAAVTRSGGFHYFESETGTGKRVFRRACSADLATARGSSIAFSDDGKSIFIGTLKEIVQFDLVKNVGQRIEVENCVGLWVDGQHLFIVTRSGLLLYEISEIELEIGSEEFRHIKIALLGHTGAGKSTLCSQIATGQPGDQSSTYGERVWTWTQSPDRRVILHDYGGQEAVVGTFIPFLGDCDMILVLFKRIEYTSLERGLRILEQIEETIPIPIPIVFVETFIDDPMDATYAEDVLKGYLDSGRIRAHVRVSPKRGDGLNELVQYLLNSISWDRAGVMVRSRSALTLTQVIETLRQTGIAGISVKDIAEKYTDVAGQPIQMHHLRFLLRNLSDEGIIQYYPDIMETVIINDREFNELRSKIPNFVNTRGGIVEIHELLEKYKASEGYVRILDEMYARCEFCVRNNGKRIFPQLLSDRQLAPLPNVLRLLKQNAIRESWVFRPRKRAQLRLAMGFTDMGLACLDMTAREGLFLKGPHTVLYYQISDIGGALEDRGLKLDWRVGGNISDVCSFLRDDIEKLLVSMFGEPTNTPVRSMIRAGEGRSVEFKESLNPYYKVARAIASFAASEGGDVLIGVTNLAVVRGLSDEYRRLHAPYRDSFQLRLKDIVKDYIDNYVLSLLSIRFEEIGGLDVCQVTVKASPREVWMKKGETGQKDVHLVIRTDNGTQRLDGTDASDYVRRRWPKP